MPDSRLQRTRKAYACPSCDGEGRIFDYEGEYECSDCDGTGVRIAPLPAVPPGQSFVCADWLIREQLDALSNSLKLAHALQK